MASLQASCETAKGARVGVEPGLERVECLGGDDSKSYADWECGARGGQRSQRGCYLQVEGKVTSELDGSEWSQLQANG